MGNSDGDTSAKANKTSAAQEPPPTTSSSQAAVYPEWGGFQAYSPIPPHGFFPSPVASSPQGHPYMWGAQLMPPYGTPPHPYVMYPHAGLYAHPSLPPGSHPFAPFAMCSPNGHAAEASGAAAAGEPDAKSSDGNEKSPLKKSKGSLGSLNMITGNKVGKTCGASNGALSQSGDSGSEDSSEGSDADSQNDTQQKPSGEQDSVDAEATQNGSAKPSNGVARTTSQQMANQPLAIVPMQVAGAPVTVTGPTTNLNIGMDYWGTPAPSSVVPVRGKVPNAPVMGGLLPSGISGSRESLPSELWLQDERELKRQRRKQSNRESARRSRLRKQAECEELGLRVENLKEENSVLRTEVNRLKLEYQQLLSQRTSLKEKLDAVSKGMVDTVDKEHAGENGKKEQLDVNAPDKAAVADQSGT